MRTGLYRQVLSLWQTAMLRLTKLQVSDEIENGLAYYRYTFLDEIPRLVRRRSKTRFAREFGVDASRRRRCLRMGSWIGGDRDGNPFVIAETLQYASRAPGVARVRALPRPRSTSSAPSCRCRRAWSRRRRRCSALAAAAHDTESASRRRAVPAGADRHLCAARGDRARARRLRAAARAAAALPPLSRRRREFLADLDVDRRVARDARRRRCSRPAACGSLRRAVERVRLSPRGARPAPELRRARSGRRRAARARRRARRLRRARRSAARRAARRRARAIRACSTSPHLTRSPTLHDASSRSCARRADIHPRFGAAALPNYVISKCQSVSDLLEVGGPAEGSRPADAEPARGQHHSAVRDDRRSRALRRQSCARRFACRATSAGSRAAAAGRK